jgi:hypothetical protein
MQQAHLAKVRLIMHNYRTLPILGLTRPDLLGYLAMHTRFLLYGGVAALISYSFYLD